MKIRIALVSSALLLALTGCATTAADPSEERTAAPVATESEAPLVAETPAAPEMSDEDATFLTYVRANLLPETQIPDASDQQLIEAGKDACSQLEAGTPLESVRVVENEQPHANGNYYDTSAIMNGAIIAYCPDAV